MPDVFISYAREDRPYAQRLAHALEQQGFTVWWDWDLIGGTNYRAQIRETIAQAKKAIVLWSRHSVNSAFVIDEASDAKRLGKLLPVLIDKSEPPFGFGDLHTITLDDPARIEVLVAALRDQPPPRRPVPAAKRRISKSLVAGCAMLVCLFAAGGITYWLSRGSGRTAYELPRSQRIALVVGNSEYRQLPHLPNAVRDADRVSEALEKRGFRVIKELNATREAMIRAVTDFESTLSVVGGVGLFYYAGSAVYIDGEDIMLPVDAGADQQKMKIVNGVNLTALLREVRSRTTHKMRDNGTAVIYSASKGQFAADGPAAGNSPFTSAFLHALPNADDELGDTFRRIRYDMDEASKANPMSLKQTPYFENTLGVKVFLGHPDNDSRDGISKILIFNSCRDNPFQLSVANETR